MRVLLKFLRGFETLDFSSRCVTVFGSARFGEEHPYYQMACSLGRRLAEEGSIVMTGGGAGYHGSGQPRGQGRRRLEPRLQYPPAHGAEAQSLSGSSPSTGKP